MYSIKFKVGDRVQIDGCLCTIKYVGPLPIWPSSIAYGVDWDDVSRGKNCGWFDGHQYFKATSEHSGSFIKDSVLHKKAQTGSTFKQRVLDKYTPAHNANVYFGSKKVETVAFKEIEKKYKDLSSITTLSLNRSLLCDAVEMEEEIEFIKKTLTNVDTLDLSYNLLSDLSTLCFLLAQFPNLKSLNLSGNRFANPVSSPMPEHLKQVKILALFDCGLDNFQLHCILSVFPYIDTLIIGNNPLLDTKDKTFFIPDTVTELDISFCQLTNVPEHLFKPRLKKLNLSHNAIKSIPRSVSSYLREMDISHNLIKHWDVLDCLNESFPHMDTLRVNDNPLFVQSENEPFYQTIARFDKVKVLNGSILSKDIRIDAELFFVGKVHEGKIQFDEQLIRWNNLSRMYPRERPIQSTEESNLGDIVLSIKIVNRNTKQFNFINVLPSFTLRYLKLICCRKFNLNLFNIKLYHGVPAGIANEIKYEFYSLSHIGICNGDLIYVESN